ncbi:unnamed protein product [Prunus armeniaca]|uniref:Mediator complex subunit 15 KIX domain-containing protein n=1 Tax=Prunus armeniaca TaxID=36596 RepID=A0A6J5TXV5_PRUAR|nr:unnamed protein product [Prunus armeniaca]
MNTLRKRFHLLTRKKCISEIKNIALKFEEKIYMAARNQPCALETQQPPFKRICNEDNVKVGGNGSFVIKVKPSLFWSKHLESREMILALLISPPTLLYSLSQEECMRHLHGSTVSVSARVPLPNSATEMPTRRSRRKFIRARGTYQCQAGKHLTIMYSQQKQLQQYQQQQQQKLLKPAQKQTSQQSVMQTPAIRPSETHVAPLSDLRQDQMSSFEQTTRSVIKNHPHTASRQIHQSQETPDIIKMYHQDQII